MKDVSYQLQLQVGELGMTSQRELKSSTIVLLHGPVCKLTPNRTLNIKLGPSIAL